MNPSFNRGQFWLLQAAVDYAPSFCSVFQSDEDLLLSFNREGHGCDRAAMVDSFESLFAWGYIEAVRYDSAHAVPQPDREQLEVYCRDKSLCYRLTQEGGAAWETFTRPDWSKFVWQGGPVCDENFQPPTLRVFEASIREVLDSLLNLARSLVVDLDEASISWEQLKPWKPKYWKTLPLGCRLSFHTREPHSILTCGMIPHHANDRWYYYFLRQDKWWCEWR